MKKIILLLIWAPILSRSPHRVPDPQCPTMTAYWSDTPEQTYTLSECHLGSSMFGHYDPAYFNQFLLPQELIPFRYTPEKSVEGAKLDILINDVLAEIQALPPKKRPKEFTHFKILKMRDVNMRDHCGLWVLKFKDYPFVVKLFIESPESFVHPTQKGFEPICFYYMAGGMSRHIAGLTRIKNMEDIKKLIADHPRWSGYIGFPTKWFWLPKHPRYIVLDGQHLGPDKTPHSEIPAIYAIVCDEINWTRQFSMSNKEDKQTAIDLSNYLDQRIDLHINNFGIEYQTEMLTLIDFEHFPSVVGIETHETECNGYMEWYTKLSLKMLTRMMFRDKKRRRAAQYRAYDYMPQKRVV